jgi:hypothetical protein
MEWSSIIRIIAEPIGGTRRWRAWRLVAVVAFGGLCGPAYSETPPSAPQNGAATTNAGPRIQFAEQAFYFGKLDSGQIIKHEFVFTNAGTEALEISAVRTSCGCTTASNWDKHVEPGRTGAIPIEFNTSGLAGTVMKTVGVICNDRVRSNLLLQITGTLWRAFDVSPAQAMFFASADSETNEIRRIKITSNTEEPVTLSEVHCTNPAFQAKLNTVREGKEFELEVTAVAPFQATTNWTAVTIKTSAAKMPLITVNCSLNVQPLIAVIPPQISLPAGPLTNALLSIVSIRNNSTNALVLSEPTVNAEGVELKLEELTPGRFFRLRASFSVGFTNPPGQRIEASLKSSFPRLPVVRIPIVTTLAPSTPIALPGAAPGTPANLGSPPADPRPQSASKGARP